MKPKLILFNGPRHSGKDTAALRCEAEFQAYHFKLSGPIKAAVKAMFELKDNTVNFLETIKTQRVPIFFDKSYVDCQISFSEDWVKPFFGEYTFGILAARHVQRHMLDNPNQELYVCSDSGFAAEAQPLIDLFGADNVLLVKPHREGKTFTGDSRSYIELDDVTTVSITNNGTIDEYHRMVDHLTAVWLAEGPAGFGND
jgi:hypothetical protein